jgi:circadian clock protein KaiB
LHQQPALAKRDRIVIVPTLIRVSPKPTVTLVGDMSNTKKLLRGLGIDLKTGEEESRGQ